MESEETRTEPETGAAQHDTGRNAEETPSPGSAGRVLLHICCAPCAVYSVQTLKAEGFEVTGLFYNPNIHPAAEYVRRRDTLRQFEAELGIKVIYKDAGYDPQIWFREVTFREANRCFHCYRVRLEKTLFIAKHGRFEYFSSTLLYSTKQKHEVIASLARDLAADGPNRFLYRDFRVGWQEGIEKSTAMGMYRQDYCGCLYSEVERRKKEVAGR
jgi:predicted adenine nucleotide alpha hydrolase (AANH) superfamily ATPase